MAEPVPIQKKQVQDVVKIALLCLTLVFGVICVLYFLSTENFRASTFFFYLVICCVVFLYTYHNVMKGKLLEKYSLAHMRLLWRYAIVKMVISLGLIVICTVVGLMSNEGCEEAFNRYYVNVIPGSLGLFWSILFFLDVRSYTKEIQAAQGDARVFHNNDGLGKGRC